MPLDTGHGSFAFRQSLVDDDAFDRQIIDLKTFLLLVAVGGAAILERDGVETLIHRGSSCLIAPGQFVLTQIPVAPATYVEAHFYFFNRRVVADLVAGSKRIWGRFFSPSGCP